MQDFSVGPGLKFRERCSAVIDVNTCHCFQLVRNVYIQESYSV